MTYPLPAWRADLRLLLVLPLLLVLSLAAPCLAVPAPPPAQAPTPALPLDLTAGPQNATAGQMAILPCLSAFVDAGGDMDVEEVAAPDMLASFRPLHPRALPHSGGVTWLRLEIPAAGMERPDPLLLDLGQGVPAGAVLHVPDIDPLSRQAQWREVRANWRGLLPLPQPGETPQVCYIRLDGLPPLWFAPTLRTLENMAGAPESLLGPGAMLGLAVVMLLALLRGITERGQWRFWTALYVGAALTHAVLGVPDLGAGNITATDAASAMTPGLALMFLAHLARHLMQTAGHSRLLDAQYLLLSLPGAALALLPLWPDFSWLGRYLPLWPLLALIFVPTTLGAWLMGVPGARRFLLGCLVAALGAALAILDLGTLVPPFIQGSLPLWGTALSALIIAGMSAPDRPRADGGDPAEPLSLGRPAQPQAITDPNLRLLDTDGTPLPLMAGLSRPAPAPVTVEAEAAAATAIRRLEQALAAPLRDLLEQNRRLGACSLSPEARPHVEHMGRMVRQALRLLHDPAAQDDGPDITPPLKAAPAIPAAPAAAGKAPAARPEKRVFDLQRLLQQTHDICRPLGQKAAIHLNWRLPADLAPRYEGPADELADVLRLLLEDAIQATARGSVQFAVRHVPDSKHPGHLLFQVRDTGTGLPPEKRRAALLARIWELAADNGGFLGVESGPRGTSILFTMRLAIPETAAETPAVLVCAPDGVRPELAAMLQGLPCSCREAASLLRGLDMTGQMPATVLLVCGPEASAEAAPLLRRYHALAGKTAPFGAVALTPDQSQWDVLAHAGFTHALTLPVTADALRETVLEILTGHDDVADLGEPLPGKTPPAEGPLPDLFGPATAPQTDQGMPDLLLPADGGPRQPAPAQAMTAPAADVPDLFAAPAAQDRDEALPAADGRDEGNDAPAMPQVHTEPAGAADSHDTADTLLPPEAPATDVDEPAAVSGATEAVDAPASPAMTEDEAPEATSLPEAMPVTTAADPDDAAREEGPRTAPVMTEDETTGAAPLSDTERAAAVDSAAPAVAPEAAAQDRDEALPAADGRSEGDDAPAMPRAHTEPAAAEAADSHDTADTPLPPEDRTTGADEPAAVSGATEAADAPASPATIEDEAPAATSLPEAMPVTTAADPDDAAREEGPGTAPVMTEDETTEAAPLSDTERAAAADSAAPAVAPEAAAQDRDEALPAADGRNEGNDAPAMPRAHTEPAAAAEAADSHDTADTLLPPEAPATGADEPVAVSGATEAVDAPASPATIEDETPAATSLPEAMPATTAADPDDAAREEGPRTAPVMTEDGTTEAAPLSDTERAAAADSAAPAVAPEAAAQDRDDVPPATARWADGVRLNAAPQPDVEEWVGEPVPVSAPVSAAAARSVTPTSGVGAYVSPSLRNAGEWVGEPMPIGTPVSRPLPVREEEAPAPVRTVVTVRPLRQSAGPDEIARQLGKPSLVPTDKSALITPPPRQVAGPDPAGSPAAQGSPSSGTTPAEEPHALPGSKDVSSPPDMTPDTNALLSSRREEPSRTRAAATTVMRFLSRFHKGSDQPADRDEEKPAPVVVPERQGTPRPIPKKENASTTADAPVTTNPWIERRAENRPVPPVRMPVPPRPRQPEPPDDPEDPLPALMWRMDNYLQEAGHALEQRRLHLVAQAAGRLAAEAESYGFRILARMARCVESAGRAKDLQAVTDLLPELATALERHRISLDS